MAGLGRRRLDGGRPLPACAQASIADPAITPDGLNAAVTQATIGVTICVQGWTKTIRPPASYTSEWKRQQLRAAGYPEHHLREFEEDHLIPLELGGAPADTRNLWPEPRHPADGWDADDKDRLESKLRRLVCDGRLPLTTAQEAIRFGLASRLPALVAGFHGSSA